MKKNLFVEIDRKSSNCRLQLIFPFSFFKYLSETKWSFTYFSENGKGTISCPDAQISDQGAYSCEAMNPKDTVMATPDAIVKVKPGPQVCQPPLYNSLATETRECERCFCFGITEECYSSSLYKSMVSKIYGKKKKDA